MPNKALRIVGLVINANKDFKPAGLPIHVHAEHPSDQLPPVASGYTHIDGGFVIPLTEHAAAALGENGILWITIDNRFGRRIAEAGEFAFEDALNGLMIEIDLSLEDDVPEAKPFWDPFRALHPAYPREISLLADYHISWDKFLEHDSETLAGKIGLDSRRLAALRLHGEMNTASPAFDALAAETIVTAGIRSRAALAALEPAQLLGLIRRAEAEGLLKLEAFEPAQAGDWVLLARGWDFPSLFRPYEPNVVSEAERRLWGALVKLNPDYSELVRMIEIGYWAQVQSIAQMRSILTAAGVYDLSALDPFVIRRRTVIGPGVHFKPAKRGVQMLDDALLYNSLLTHGGAFAKVATVDVLEYGVSIVPNPVTQAVILGPLVQFIENAELVIGKDVTSLIIVTDSIDYDAINKIRYEDPNRTPPNIASFTGRPGFPSDPPNFTNVYRPGSQDRKGRDGLRGIDGSSGREGFGMTDPAPSIKVYVKQTPKGLPNIDVTGRRGGIGQDGQDGGPGENGAKGRESVGSFWLFCVTNVGHGGDAGSGGNGGNGGRGGQGGSGGDVELFSPLENLPNILSRPEFFIGISGGDGGAGGQAGARGPRGTGGEAGHDTAGCDAHPEWKGADGQDGQPGMRGEAGERGRVGRFHHVPITLDQWNAAFTYPYLLRLEPWSGPPGTKIDAVGLNITQFAALEFGGAAVDAAFDSAKNKATFFVPEDAGGGLWTVMIKLKLMGATVPGLDQAKSNTVHFRVTPQIDSISPMAGVPGQSITITGKGFSMGAQVLLGGKTFAVDDSSFSTTELTLPLPFLEDIGLPAGAHELKVQNPDAAESNPVTFTLSLVYSLRMRAWRVFPGDIIAGGGPGSFGTNREVEEIQDILVNNENSPGKYWARHGIILSLGPITDAQFPEPWGDGSVPKNSDPAPIATSATATGGGIPFDPGAINFYFISDIDDATTHAYVSNELSIGSDPATPPTVVFEDTASLSTNKAAIVASHELGHAFGLRHVCAKDADSETVSATLFARVCVDLDQEYLMYPRANWHSTTGSTLTSEEAMRARRAAVKLHGK